MNTLPLKQIGLSENEVKIYLALLKSGTLTAYELSKKTGIYRVHVYDKIEQLMDKALVTHVFKGAKKYFQAAPPEKIKQYLDDKKKTLERQEQDIEQLLPALNALLWIPKEDTRVEVFKGPEGLKYFLKDIINTKQELLVTGIDDSKYNEALPVFMKQYFRDMRRFKIPERVITAAKQGVFQFPKDIAPTTTYRYLAANEFNPTNTFVYADKTVIVTWGNPVTAVMITNKGLAQTYREHFEHLWNIASEKMN